MKRHSVISALLIVFLTACCSVVQAQEQKAPAPKPEPKLTNWYKIEIILSEFDDGKRTNTRSYTIEAEEGMPASIKLGDRVPIVTGGPARAEEDKLLNVQFQYLDVGLNITSWVWNYQGRLGLKIDVDQSSIAVPNTSALRVAPNQPMIRQLRMQNTAFVTLGKPTLITSVDDPGKANHKYTIEATLTKMNP